MCNVVVIKSDCTFFADILASVSKTASAGICYFVTADRTFVAGNIDNFNHVGIELIAAHCNLYSFGKNCTFFINTATHCGFITGNKILGDIENVVIQGIIPRESCNFTQNFVFKILNFGVKLSHNNSP